jgi:glucosamine-6-phosphate deaminase
MKITVTDTEKNFFDCVAWRIAVEITNKPDAVIGFSTGRTTKGIHASLANLHKNYLFDTSKMTVFGLDEITNISREYFGSCYYILLHEVVEPLGVSLENYLMPPVYSDDFNRECRNFEAVISARGSVTLQILGIGENGHIGFNQPGTPFNSDAWLSKMDENLDRRIRRETGSAPDAPLGGLTLGIRNIMHTKKIVLAANGTRKAQIIHDAICGPVTEKLPASVLQLHPDCEVILDAEAASLLKI